MLGTIKELFLLLDKSQRKQFYFLQILVVLMVFTEIAGVVSIAPFMAVVADPQILEKSGIIGQLYRMSGMNTPYEFLFWLGIGVLLILTLSAIIGIYTTWRLLFFSSKVGMELGERLYTYYMFQPWLFHATRNSSNLTKQITQETGRVMSQIINPLLQLNAKIIFICFMLITIFSFEPYVAIAGFSIFFMAYLGIYKFVRKKVYKNGLIISDTARQRFKLIAEGFGGIKDTILLGKQQTFVKKFSEASTQYAYSQSTNAAFAQTPRYFIELIALSSVVFLILYLINTNDGELSTILPLLSMYALAGLKLLPAFQQMYSKITTIKGAIPAFKSIQVDLYASKSMNMHNEIPDIKTFIFPTNMIELKNISFTYPDKEIPALQNLSIHIPVNNVIGIVGPSGSGKSTLIDILLGLIKSDSGAILTDGMPINTDQVRSWQNNIGYVPQSIFLLDGSIAENVAFGIEKDSIDLMKVKQVLELAHLTELIEELPDGLASCVGERGVQLSGGQKQRIGIARSLYHDADLLVFDEATSALDGITEKLIMDAIHDFSGKKTIVLIAHRLKTIEKCDIIYFMDKGSIVDSGSYLELIERNQDFKKMALHA